VRVRLKVTMMVPMAFRMMVAVPSIPSVEHALAGTETYVCPHTHHNLKVPHARLCLGPKVCDMRGLCENIMFGRA